MQGVCNGVKVYCDNDEAVDEGSGDGGQNYWWVPWGTKGSICESAEVPDSGCNPSDAHCCPDGVDGLCFCKRFTVQDITQYSQAIGDMGPLCVGQGHPGDNNVDPLEDWNSGEYPTIDSEIREWCSARCVFDDYPIGGPSPQCQDANWSGHQTLASWSPSNSYNCEVPEELNVDDPDGSEIPWELVGGSSSPMPLDCDLNGDCVEYFYSNIASFILTPGSGNFIDPETRTAHYLAVEGTGSQLAIDMPGSGSGVDDTEALFGQAEYTASDCGEDVCPFFLANLSAFNTTDTWSIEVLTVEGTKKKGFIDLQIDLLQSTLGVQNMSLETVAFAPGSLRMLVQFTVRGTGIGAGDHAYVVENADYLFADYDDGSLSLEHEFDIQLTGGTATLTVDLVPDEHPPVADHDLGSSEPCDWITGILIDGRSTSTDPDNDIVFEMWWIDGATCINNCWVGFGTHDVSIEAHDARGAVHRTAEHEVTVTNGPNCAIFF